MKKAFLFPFILFISILTAQNPVKDDFQLIFDQIYSNLNTSFINTGYLYERTYHSSKLDLLDGTKDTAILGTAWREVYDELYRMSVNIPTLKQLDELTKGIEPGLSRNQIPFFIFYNNYNYIDNNAFANHLLDTLNKKIIDVFPRFQSPYQIKQLFAASPASTSLGYGTVTFIINSQFVFSNKKADIKKVEIDFDDGAGYQLVNLTDYAKVINYPDTLKHLITVRLTNQANQQFIAKTQYQSLGNTTPLGSFLPYNYFTNAKLTSEPIHEQGFWVSASKSYNGPPNRMYCTISYGMENGQRRTKIKNPILLVEGFDTGFLGHSGYNSLGKCGSLGYIDLKTGRQKKYDGSDKATEATLEEFPQFQHGPLLIQTINEEGYDLVYVDFEKGTDFMQNNAFALVELINQINSIKKQNGVCGDNVIIGASMGGQIARYALNYMEKNKLNHSCRLFGMFDSPNDGANIPLGFQYFIDYFADHILNIKGSREKVKFGRDAALTSVAARQLLKYHYMNGGATNSLRNSFMNEMDQMGSFPILPKITIVNGNLVASKQNISDGQKMLTLNIPVSSGLFGPIIGLVGCFWGPAGCLVGSGIGSLIGKYIVHDYEGDVYALNTANDKVFRGTSPFNPIVNKFPPSTFLKYDNAPGGQANTVNEQNSTVKNSKVFQVFGTEFYSPFTTTDGGPFCFIPANSSMAIKAPFKDNLNLNIRAALGPDADNPNSAYTIFDSYYAPPVNQYHVLITPEAISYLIGKLKEGENILGNQLPNNYNNSLHTTYNFTANKYRKKLYGVTIENNGKLYFNGNINKEYGIPPTNLPQAGSTLTIETSDCGPVVSIQSGSQLILGSSPLNSTPNNFAILKFKTGSTLFLKAGSKLIVNNGSQLIMEPGSKFIIEPGAEIELQGRNALIDVQAGVNPIVQIDNGETLKITKGPFGEGGVIKFADGTMKLLYGSRLINDGCSIVVGTGTHFSIQANAEIQLMGISSLLDVKKNGNTEVLVQTGSTLNINKGNASEGGRIQLVDGLFQLFSASHFIIDGCKVIIGQDMLFAYGLNTDMQIWDDNAVLDLKGNLILSDGANFTFTYAGHSSGYVKFSREGWWGGAESPHIIAGTGCSMIFNGMNQNDKVIEVTQESLYAPDNLAQLTITNGLVALGPGSRLNIPCRFSLQNTKVTSVQMPFTHFDFLHRGIQLFGQQGVIIRNSVIEHGSYGINAALFYRGNMLTVSNCTIQNCGTGIKTTGVGLNLNNVKLLGFGAGLEIDGADRPSTISGCEIANNNVGVLVNNGTSLPEIRIVNCTIHDNTDSGIENNGGNVLIRCGSVKNNLLQGIYAGPGSVTNLSSLFGAGYTDLSGNAITVNTLTANDLKLAKGFNDFEITENQNSRYAFGLGMKTVIPLVMEGSLNQYWGNVIDASNNKWNAAGVNLSAVPFVERFYRLIGTGAPDSDGNRNITLKDDATPKIASCPVIPPGPGPGPVVFDPTLVGFLAVCTTCPIINSSSFLNVKYNDAVTFALKQSELVDSTKNDLSAINLLHEILMTKIDSANPQVLAIAQLATQQIGLILSHAFQTGKITPVLNAAVLSPPVQQVADVYNRLKAPATSINYLSQFNNDLAIGQIQRLAGSRTMAIQQFQSIDNCFLTEKELIQVKNWVNMTTAENLVVTGVQPKDRFDSLWKFIPIPVLKATKIGNNNSINSTAMIGAGVKIGNNAQIAQGVSIGANVTIGNNVQIKKNVQIMDGAIIKDNVQINESSIIGKKTVVGVNAQIKKQVVIGDDVTIADNVQINDNVRIGNLVNIGTSSQIKQQAKIGDGSFIFANVIVNQNCIIGSNIIIRTNAQIQQQVVVGDGSIIGSNVIIAQSARIGAAVIVSDNLTIGQNAKVSDGSTITANVAQNSSFGTTLPTPPSGIMQNTNNCAFAKARAKVIGNYFNGFTATNADTSIHNFSPNQGILFKAASLGKTYLWNFGDCTTSSVENPVHSYAKPGTYVVTLTISIKCVSATVTGAITVYPLPVADFTVQPTLVCGNTNKILLNKSNLIGNLSPSCQTTLGTCGSFGMIDSSMYRIQFNWDFGQFKPALQEVFTFRQLVKNQDSLLSITYPEASTYPISLKATLQVKDNISNTWKTTQFVNQKIINAITGTKLQAFFDLPFSACASDSAVFNNFTSGGRVPITYQWKFSNNVTSTQLSPKIKFGTEGIYTIKLIVTDALGCKDSVSAEMFVPKCPAKPITGILLSAASCGSQQIVGDTLIIKTTNNATVNSVTPIITDNAGEFTFNGDELTLLDTTQRYRIATQSGLAIQDTTSRTIKNWIALTSNLLHLVPNFPTQFFTKVTTGDIVNLGRTTSSSWGDYDGDGDLDVIAFCNPANALYRNDCNGNFAQVIGNALSTPTTPFNSTPAEWIDYDNDGDLDIILYKVAGGTGVPQSAQLYQNDGSGNFTLITTGQMVNDTLSPRSASVVDFDNDGYLDVFVANRNRPNILYRNNGTGDFIKVTGSLLNSLCTPTLSQGSTWGDYDNDGDMDVYIGGGGAFSCFYQNNGNGTFTQNNDSLLTTVVGSNYGPAWVDYDNDSDLDLFLQIAFAPNLLFMNNNNGSFTKVTVAPFLNGNENAQGGPTFGDYDNDGDLDLFLANVNGHRNRFYVNNGNGTFVEDTVEIITNDLLKESFAATFADIDNDGDLDLYVNNVNNAFNDNHNFLYVNKGSCNNWVKVKCIGTQTNKQAVGARIYVKATINGVQTTQMREINGNCNLTGGANGVTTNEAHFGLGNATTITELKVVWPKSGITQIFTNISPDNFYDITENINQLVVHSECGGPALVMKKLDDKTTTNSSTSNSNPLLNSIATGQTGFSGRNSSVKVYPNPNNGTITVEISGVVQDAQSQTEFRLYNMTGQLIYSKNLMDTNNSLDLTGNGVENGIYYFTINSNGTTIKQDKLVVIK